MEKGIKIGVKVINDISGLNFDQKTKNILKKYKIPFVIHHSKGTPENMQIKPSYKNELLDIYDFFEKKIESLRIAGIKHNNIIIDPGIGFGKNLKHNLMILNKISIFHSLGFPILIGTSRKRFISQISKNFDSKERLGGTLSSILFSLAQGIQIFRVHNVREIKQGILVFQNLLNK
jgi:dihydropteroate synthase